MKNVLFIYGYGGSPQSHFCTLIREALPKDEYNVLCPQYPKMTAAKLMISCSSTLTRTILTLSLVHRLVVSSP